MIGDPRIPLISFTGSVRMGRHVAERVARRLGRTILELGGNNGIIVTAQADLELAVRAILFGAVGTAGQRCTTSRCIIVHQPVAEELTRRLIDAYRQVAIGDPMEEGTLMGPLLNEAAVQSMKEALDRIVAEGGEILWRPAAAANGTLLRRAGDRPGGEPDTHRVRRDLRTHPLRLAGSGSGGGHLLAQRRPPGPIERHFHD